MSEWRPIETAPKDKEVLVYDPSNDPPVFTAELTVFKYMDSKWDCSVEGRYAPEDAFFGDSPKNPTHWMPLPEPPE